MPQQWELSVTQSFAPVPYDVLARPVPLGPATEAGDMKMGRGEGAGGRGQSATCDEALSTCTVFLPAISSWHVNFFYSPR